MTPCWGETHQSRPSLHASFNTMYVWVNEGFAPRFRRPKVRGLASNPEGGREKCVRVP